jgi:hypothetical protein
VFGVRVSGKTVCASGRGSNRWLGKKYFMNLVLYSPLSDIIGVIKSSRMIRVGHVVRNMAEYKCMQRFGRET